MSKKENAQAENTTAPAPLVTAKFDPSKLKVVKHVTLPILKFGVDEPVYIKIINPIHKGKKLAGEAEDKEPVDLIDVINLLTGEPAQIVGGTILVNTLIEDYPDHGYVGRMFQVTKLAAKGSGANKYHPYSILEVAE